MGIEPRVKKRNSHRVALENESSILEALYKFGYLKTRQISHLIWPNSPEKSGMEMAQITLRRLKKMRQILSDYGPDGSVIHALSLSGSRRVRDETGIDARSGKHTIKFTNKFAHRALCNDFAIRLLVEDPDRVVYTEHEIQSTTIRKTAPPIRICDKKIPDVLIDVTDIVNMSAAYGATSESRGYAWVEIENSWKNNKRMKAALLFFFGRFGRLRSDGHAEPIYAADSHNLSFIMTGVFAVQTENQAQRIVRLIDTMQEDPEYKDKWEWDEIRDRIYIITPEYSKNITLLKAEAEEKARAEAEEAEEESEE